MASHILEYMGDMMTHYRERRNKTFDEAKAQEMADKIKRTFDFNGFIDQLDQNKMGPLEDILRRWFQG